MYRARGPGQAGAGHRYAARVSFEVLRPPPARATITLAQEHLPMSDHVYKVTELVGTSPDGLEQAIENAVNRANKTLRNMRWLEVQQIRGHIESGAVQHWQVIVKIGFTLDD
jgi:flavin-binding protein dodecin